MDEDTYSISLPESSDASEKLEAGGALVIKVPFLVPDEGYVVGYGTRYQSRTFSEGLTRVDVRFYDTNNNMYDQAIFYGDVNQINISPPSTTPRGRNAIHYRFGSDSLWGMWMDTGWFHVADPPVLKSPSAHDTVYTTSNPVFSGTGDAGYSARVQLRRASDGVHLSGWVTVPSNNQWNMTLNSLATGRYEAYLAGSGTYWQVEHRGATFSFIVLREPQITFPAHNTFVVERSLTIRGTSLPNARVDLAYPGGTALVLDIPVDSKGDWTTTINNVEQNRELSFQARARFSGKETGWSAPAHKINLLGAPSITSHTNGSTVDQTITVSGTIPAPFRSGTVFVYRDATTTELGRGTVNASTGAWAARVTLTPGNFTITAAHVFSSVTSMRSSSLALKVRPPLPLLEAPNPASGLTPVLTGTGGFNGAILKLLDATNEDLGGTNVTSNSWSVSPRTDLVPGIYAFKVQQTVNDMTSLVSNVRTFTVTVPEPTLTTPIVVTDQKPTFRGTGKTWAKQTEAAKVEVRLNNAAVPIVPIVDVTNNAWISAATERWAPGSYLIIVRQLYKALFTPWSTTKPTVVIPAPLPVISTVQPEGFSPRITGTCWPGASLSLTYSDRPTVTHPITGAGGTWTFRRDIPFTPSDHTFTVTQTYGGQTSGEGTGSFNIPTPKLGITKPATSQQVGLKPTFEGTDGYIGAELKIYDAISGSVLGSKTLTATGAWSLLADVELPTGPRVVYAVQSFNSQASVRSDERTFQVIILAPSVQVPALNGRLPRLGRVSGTDAIPGALITLKLAGVTTPVADNIPVQADGSWEAPSGLTEVGQGVLLATQTYKGQPSGNFERPFTIVPAAPYLETPVSGQAISGKTMASGFGYPGDTVTVHRRGGNGPYALATVVVKPDGTWSVEFTWNAAWTNHSLSAQAKKSDLNSDYSPMHSIGVRSAVPSLHQPAIQEWVGAAPTFTGTGLVGAQITVASWFDRQKVLATTVVQGGSWSVRSSVNLDPGLHRVVVWQTVGEVDSADLISEPFIVE